MFPSKLTIDTLTTATPNLADVPPKSIEHRCLEYCYTKLDKCTPKSIKHRSLEYCYIKLGKCFLTPSQSSTDALNTTTPNLADVPPVNSA